MTEIVLVSDRAQTKQEAEELLKQHSFVLNTAEDEKRAEEFINSGSCDIVLYDCCSCCIDIPDALRRMKLMLQTKDIRSILLLPEKNINYSLLSYADSFIARPFDEKLFYAAIYSQLQIRNSLSIFSRNSSDLAASLYQLNVLYETGARLAGTLDKTKLIEIAADAFNQSLSPDLCYALILNDFSDIKLIIKSVFPMSESLENAVKLRALLNFQNLFSINPDIKDIKVFKTSRKQFDSCSLNIFGYNNLSEPVNIKNKFYGIIEVFRETAFSEEDKKCFSAVVKQTLLPLENAVIYDELKAANNNLEKLEHMKSEFISIVSHELKTPLTSINSVLDIILNGAAGEINDAVEKFLNLAKRNAGRLSAIILDLLDLSKIEAGKMEFRFEKTNINNSVLMAAGCLENPARERGITIKMKLQENIDNVYIDPQRIEQVLANLISNAVKFTPENGFIEISSSVITADDIKNNKFFSSLPENLSGRYIQIAVKDNGTGIAEENHHKIFEQFKQIENSLSRKSGGSGLGLPIAKRLICAHKGFIWLESALNKGSVFYIAVPVMNEKEIFELSLEQDIQKAKQDKINIALFSLNEKTIEGKSFIDKILSEEIIRKTSVFKDYSVIKNGRRYYYSYAADIDSFVFDFEVRRLEGYIQEEKAGFKECGIEYSSALYPQDGACTNDLIFKLNKYTKGDIHEENTDS